MLHCIDTQKINDAVIFGETLREAVFVKKHKNDYGCYSTFELNKDFFQVANGSPVGQEILKMLEWGDDDFNAEEINKEIEDKAMIYTNNKIIVAWYWDGDGTLLFKEGERIAINTDCKKDYTWNWIKS